MTPPTLIESPYLTLQMTIVLVVEKLKKNYIAYFLEFFCNFVNIFMCVLFNCNLNVIF